MVSHIEEINSAIRYRFMSCIAQAEKLFFTNGF